MLARRVKPAKDSIAFAFFQSGCPEDVSSTMSIQVFGKQFGSSGHHSLGEVLFVSFVRSFKPNLFGLCLISEQVTTPQNVCLLPW